MGQIQKMYGHSCGYTSTSSDVHDPISFQYFDAWTLHINLCVNLPIFEEVET